MLYQWEAIQTITHALKERGDVLAVYLKGSFARGEEDPYSDVDLYCIVKEEAIESFLPIRIALLSTYRPILYSSEANFVGPQIVCVYDNGLHFDLYTQTLSTQSKTDVIKVLYDPENVLESYVAGTFPLAEKACDTIFDECTFVGLEFFAAFKRGDYAWSMRLCSHHSGNLSLLLRHLYDPAQAQLGMKRLQRYLPEDLRKRFETAVLAPLPENMKQLFDIQWTIREAFNGNLDFLKYIKSKIDAL